MKAGSIPIYKLSPLQLAACEVQKNTAGEGGKEAEASSLAATHNENIFPWAPVSI